MSRPCRPWPVRAGAGPSGTFPFDFEGVHEVFKNGRVPALARPPGRANGRVVAVNLGVDLSGQPAAGAADGVIIRLMKQINVSGLSISLPPRSAHARRLDRLGVWIGHQLPVGQRWRARSVLHQPVEQQPTGTGMASVEAEAELFQIGLQMVGTHAALVSAQ